MNPFYPLVIHFDEPRRGPRGERCFIIEDDTGHQLMLLQPLSEMGDGEDFARHARLLAAATELFNANQAQEDADLAWANCPDCEGEEMPELCPTCFPLHDRARIMRREALAKARKDPTP